MFRIWRSVVSQPKPLLQLLAQLLARLASLGLLLNAREQAFRFSADLRIFNLGNFLRQRFILGNLLN